MEGKYTKGPFSVYRDEENLISITKWMRRPNGGSVGVNLAKLPIPGNYLTQEEINANGYLFSAAYEMLEALQSFVSLCRDKNGSWVGTINIAKHPNVTGVECMARAAIAKALGESQ